MNSKTSICNLALAYLGQAPISSLEQENEKARWLKLFYFPVLEEVLRTHDWAFAATQKQLVRVSGLAESEGKYVYKYPADALFIRRVVAGNTSLAQSFTQYFDTSRHMRVLVTTAAQAVAHYTRRITDPTQYDPAFVKCFALALACDTALALTGDVDLTARLQQKYALYLQEARRTNTTEIYQHTGQDDAFSEVR